MKPAIFFVLAIICGFAALYYMGMTVQSVDYRDGMYHPIPRERYGISFLALFIAILVFWKLGRRSSQSIGVAE